MTDTHRRSGLGAVFLGNAFCTAATLWPIYSELLSKGLVARLVVFGATLSTLLCLASGVGLILPPTRWQRRTEQLGRAALLLLLLGGLLNLLMSLPSMRLNAVFRQPDIAVQTLSTGCTLLVLLWFWRDANAVLRAGHARTCPWRFTVFASLSILVAALASLTAASRWFQVSFGETGMVVRGFPLAEAWNAGAACAAGVTIALAAMHHRFAVWSTAGLALWCGLLAPLLLVTVTRMGLLNVVVALINYAAGPLFLATLFAWLAAELRSRINP